MFLYLAVEAHKIECFMVVPYNNNNNNNEFTSEIL